MTNFDPIPAETERIASGTKNTKQKYLCSCLRVFVVENAHPGVEKDREEGKLSLLPVNQPQM